MLGLATPPKHFLPDNLCLFLISKFIYKVKKFIAFVDVEFRVEIVDVALYG